MIRCSAVGLGVDTDDRGAVISAEGEPARWLYTLGSTRRGQLWETTAVPELRLQAQALSQTLLASLVLPLGLPLAIPLASPQLIAASQPGDSAVDSLIFRQLFDRESCTYSYLIGSRGSAILVDPVLEQVERDLQLLEQLGLRLHACLETHVHADHVTGAGRLRSLTNCLIIVPEKAGVNGADHEIGDGEVLELHAIRIQAIATPGHTDSHVAYLVNQSHLLTGDALFIRGCGRTDFQGGDADLLYQAVTQKLFTLPDQTLVYPGHDYQGRTVSTIAEERRWNPRFAGLSQAEFVELMGTLDLPEPKKLKQALPANQRCGVILELVEQEPVKQEPVKQEPVEQETDAVSADLSLFYGMYI